MTEEKGTQSPVSRSQFKEEEMAKEKEAPKKVSRREFVKGAAVGAAGIAAAGALASCAPAATPTPTTAPGATPAPAATCPPAPECPPCATPWMPEKWDYEADVVVAGYGTGGSAAIEAEASGAKVLILEKEPLPGGCMGRCWGGIFGGPTEIQKELGLEDSADEIYKWLMAVGKNTTDPDIARVFADNCGPNVDWLMKLGVDYGDGVPVPTSLGYPLQGGLDNSGAPYEDFGFADVPPRSHWAQPKEPGMAAGPELFTPLYATIKAKGIEALFETKLVELITNLKKEVVGVRAESKGKTVYIKARKGVVLATGGFEWNKEMQRKFNPEMLEAATFITPAATGDGIIAAEALGADLRNMWHWARTPAFLMPAEDEEETRFFCWDVDGTNDWNGPLNTNTRGGVVINPQAQVMDVFGKAIPRLYGTGLVTGCGIFGDDFLYSGCGSYIAYGICFGRIGGRNAAALEPWV